MIERNAKLNRLENIVVHPRAVGDREGLLPVLDSQGSLMMLASDQDPRLSTKVQVVRLDDDYDHSRKVDFLKIDVDGADLEVLLGAPKILSQRPYINLELHTYLFDNPVKTVSTIMGIFQDLNYSFKVDAYDGKDVVDVGMSPDITWLTSFKFVQLFCTPV